MIGIGTIVNAATILIGGLAGLILKKYLPKRIAETVMQGVGLAVIIIGISGALSSVFKIVDGGISSDHILLMIISLVIGGLIGELIGIEKRLDSFAVFCESKLKKPGSESTFTQGFVTATLVFCVGSMAIVGSLEDGINKNSDILFAKSTLDAVTAMIFASTLGIGVLFSAIPVGVYQGTITILAISVAPYLSDTLITQMSLIGSVLIMAIGLNMLHISKIKTGNLLPAIFIPVLYQVILGFLA
ncbi:MAG: DUF554 domain-containing protein [Oscillospiraceae bacterium]|nr:DUF554 domain-containing protein [Oscillospiraceae bacterium]